MLKHISTLALAALIAMLAGCIYYDHGYGYGHHHYRYYDGGYYHWDGWDGWDGWSHHHRHPGRGRGRGR